MHIPATPPVLSSLPPPSSSSPSPSWSLLAASPPPPLLSLLLDGLATVGPLFYSYTTRSFFDDDGGGGGGGGDDGGGDEPGGGPKKELQNWSSLIGIVTAIVGNVLIALALNVQRYAHTRLHRQRIEVRERARQALRNAQKHGVGLVGDVHGEIADDGNGNGNGNGHATHGGDGYGTLRTSTSSSDSAAQRRRGGADVGDEEAGLGIGLGHRESDPLTSSFRSGGDGDNDDDDTDEDDDGSVGGGLRRRSSISSTNYLKSPYWWLGQVLITVGEMGNFLAYGFAPASIVSPLGVVALVSNCVIAPIFFKELLRPRDVWGVVVAIAGAVTVVLSASSKETKLAPHDVWSAITTLAFEVYMAVTCSLIVLLMWASPRYGNRTILIDLGLVGLFGGYTALATKGVSSMLSSTLLGAFTTPVTYALVFVLLATAVMQVRYVNKALQRFDSTQVIPIQFVTFTLSVIIGSAVLYRDFERSTAEQAVKFVGGCLLTFFGVFLITSGRPRQDVDPDDDEGSLSDVEGIEETISLSQQQGSDAAGPAAGGGGVPSAAVGGDAMTRSRRSSRVSFKEAASSRPLTVLADTGVPSSRIPPSKAVPLDAGGLASIEAEDPSLLAGNNPWRLETPPTGRNGIGPRAFSADAVLTISDPGSNAASEPSSNPATPLSHPSVAPLSFFTTNAAAASPTSAAAAAAHVPVDRPTTPRPPPIVQPLQPSTPASSSSRPHSHHFPGPLFSPSPLSSTVSAVVGDALLLAADGGGSGGTLARRRVALRQSRPSLRTSLFVPYDELEHQHHHHPQQQTPHNNNNTHGPLLSADDSAAVMTAAADDSEWDDTTASSPAASHSGFRGRARSLSNTLGGLFASRARRRRSNPEEDGDRPLLGGGGERGGGGGTSTGDDLHAAL